MKKRKNISIFKLLVFPFLLLYTCLVYILVCISYIKEGIVALLYRNNVAKMTGIEFEIYIASLLEANGFHHVETTKASNDYGIDLLAVKGQTLYAFQCKKYSSKVGVEAVRQASTGCIYYDYDIPVVITNSTFSSQAIRLAETLEVELWDSHMLHNLQKRYRVVKKRKRILFVVIFLILCCIGIIIR